MLPFLQIVETLHEHLLHQRRSHIQQLLAGCRGLYQNPSPVGFTSSPDHQSSLLQSFDNTGYGTLAKAISLSQGTVTGIIERLERRGLVVRRRSESDRRRVLVQTTAAGQQLLDAAPPLMQEMFVERFNNLQEWEQTMILSSLQRLVTIMDAKSIEAAAILSTTTIDESATNSELEK